MILIAFYVEKLNYIPTFFPVKKHDKPENIATTIVYL